MASFLRSSSNASSGMGVSDDCKHIFLELQRKKTHRYVIFKIDEKRKEVIVDKTGGTAESFDDFMAALPENDCRYAIYDFDFVTQENCQKSKIFFIAWMDLEINSGTSTGGKGIKHIWTPGEDAALVEALSELCISGHWKVENGFRAGYLTQLEKKLAEKLPNCDLRATPHIESRVKTLKKQTLAINDMLSNSSGFAWNDDQKMVVCEKQVYEQWAKCVPAARGLRNKPFPHYDSLMEIFGKDRATGKGAEGPAEAVEDLTNDDHSAFNFFEDATNDEVEDTTPPTQTPRCPPSKGGLKRKRNTESWSENLGDMVGTLRSFVEVTKTHYDTMREVFAGEHAATQRRGKVVDELMQVEGLTSTDVLEASAAIIGDDSKIDLLFTLPDYLKRQWVDMLLNRH